VNSSQFWRFWCSIFLLRIPFSVSYSAGKSPVMTLVLVLELDLHSGTNSIWRIHCMEISSPFHIVLQPWIS
ncbi:hypothetical protein Leryth_027613, partial [Lithospermum erythrorhizon]